MKDAWDSELNKKLWHYNKNCLKNPEEKLKENYYPVNNTMYHITRDCLDTFPSKEERISISKDRRRFFCTKNGKINDDRTIFLIDAALVSYKIDLRSLNILDVHCFQG